MTGQGSQLFQALSYDDADRISKRLAIRTVPSTVEIAPDESLPERIRGPFVEIQEDARRRRHATGIMSVARGCLDVALKDKGETSGGRRERIKNLATRHLLTDGIAEWAQTLWEDGSDAAHDLEADLDRAIEHVEFLRLFFEVLYALPHRIAAAKTTTEGS